MNYATQLLIIGILFVISTHAADKPEQRGEGEIHTSGWLSKCSRCITLLCSCVSHTEQPVVRRYSQTLTAPVSPSLTYAVRLLLAQYLPTTLCAEITDYALLDVESESFSIKQSLQLRGFRGCCIVPTTSLLALCHTSLKAHSSTNGEIYCIDTSIAPTNQYKEKIHLGYHGEGISSIDASPDGLTLLSVPTNSNSPIKFWSLEHKQQQRHVEIKSKERIEAAKFSLDGRYVITASNKFIDLAKKKNGYFVSSLAGHSDQVRAIALSQNHLASGSRDQTAKLWDIEISQAIRTFSHDTDAQCINAVALSSAESLIAAGDNNKTTLWDIRGEKIRDRYNYGEISQIVLVPPYLIINDDNCAMYDLRFFSPQPYNSTNFSKSPMSLACDYRNGRVNVIAVPISSDDQQCYVWQLPYK